MVALYRVANRGLKGLASLANLELLETLLAEPIAEEKNPAYPFKVSCLNTAARREVYGNPFHLETGLIV